MSWNELSDHVVNPLVLKFERFARLSQAERDTIETTLHERVRVLNARQDIMEEGDKPAEFHVVLSGWACRYKQLKDGRRQIIALLLPGDCCDPHMFILRETDHAVGALTPVTLARLSPEAAEKLFSGSERLKQALWWATEVDSAIQREWVVNLGQRDSFERIAHLLCEIFHRSRVIGLVEDDACDFPLTQTDLAEATGMTPVHVNRTLQELRTRCRIRLTGKRLVVPDLPALQRAGLFDPNYLHLDYEGRHLDAPEP